MTRPTPLDRETIRDRFNRLADKATTALGSVWAVALSVVVVVVWAVTGPVFGFSDSWQLVINTSTTVITFWMVFVIQNSQNRDARAVHLKLDEIIRATSEARNEFIVAERATEAQVEAHEQELQGLVANSPSNGTEAALTDPPSTASPQTETSQAQAASRATTGDSRPA